MNCPHCNADLTGDPIPADIAHHYSQTHWDRQIGLSDGDSVFAWKCPDCDHEWLRSEYYRTHAERAGRGHLNAP